MKDLILSKCSESMPIILALDVTKSMGSSLADVKKQIPLIVQSLYDRKMAKNAEIMCMGIGDFATLRMTPFRFRFRNTDPTFR